MTSTTASTDPADAHPVPTLFPTRHRSGQSDTVEITVYVVTGPHGILRIPDGFCKECNLFTRAAFVAADQVEVEVNIRVVSWWTHFLGALRHGGYHPPVMVVGGKKIAQGHDVPTPDDVTAAIHDARDQ